MVFARIKLARSLRELATRAAAGMVVEDQPGRHKLPEQGTTRRYGLLQLGVRTWRFERGKQFQKAMRLWCNRKGPLG